VAKAPEVGDRIEHTCTLNGKFEGVVEQLLSMQFTYMTDDGHSRFCMYKEVWRKIDEG
jgi:hypothetical protein